MINSIWGYWQCSFHILLLSTILTIIKQLSYFFIPQIAPQLHEQCDLSLSRSLFTCNVSQPVSCLFALTANQLLVLRLQRLHSINCEEENKENIKYKTYIQHEILRSQANVTSDYVRHVLTGVIWQQRLVNGKHALSRPCLGYKACTNTANKLQTTCLRYITVHQIESLYEYLCDIYPLERINIVSQLLIYTQVIVCLL